MMINSASGLVAIRFGLRGPNFTVASACATGNHALGVGLNFLRWGLADLLFVGASEAAITPTGLAGFCAARALSTRNDDPQRASRPFDKDRDGFVFAEGAGVLVLETLEHARARGAKPLAELTGCGMSDDAFHITAPHEEGTGAARAMSLALEDAGLAPSDVQYINAHGTSTPWNDKIETTAIKKVFGERAAGLAISSTKSMLGHLIGASGAVELAVTICAIREGIAPPTTNYETPDPECDLDYVPNEARPLAIESALSNSFGFGGHNACIAVRRFSEA
jgi:3-oxoacyl-[acyl-carrier-protein] synthase II